MLWLVGIIGNAVGGIGDLIKIPPILADLAIGWLVWSMVRELGGRDRLALAAAAVAVLNPICWFDSVVWGQVDSFGVVFLLLGLRELWRDQPGAIRDLHRHRRDHQAPARDPHPARRGRDHPARAVAGRRSRRRRDAPGRPLRILTTGLAGFLTAVVLCAAVRAVGHRAHGQPPFVASGLLQQVAVAAGGYPYLTVNAYNPWASCRATSATAWPTPGCGSATTPGPRQLRRRDVAVFGPIPAVVIGTALLLAVIGAVLVVAARRPDRLTLLVGLTVLALAFFVLPTRVHERYGFPVLRARGHPRRDLVALADRLRGPVRRRPS